MLLWGLFLTVQEKPVGVNLDVASFLGHISRMFLMRSSLHKLPWYIPFGKTLFSFAVRPMKEGYNLLTIMTGILYRVSGMNCQVHYFDEKFLVEIKLGSTLPQPGLRTKGLTRRMCGLGMGLQVESSVYFRGYF